MKNAEIKQVVERSIQQERLGLGHGGYTRIKSRRTVERFRKAAEELGCDIEVRPACHRISRKVRGYDVDIFLRA